MITFIRHFRAFLNKTPNQNTTDVYLISPIFSSLCERFCLFNHDHLLIFTTDHFIEIYQLTLILLKNLLKASNFTKSNTSPWLFLCFLNCTNGTISSKISHRFAGLTRKNLQISSNVSIQINIYNAFYNGILIQIPFL